jgi:hypothetical protein
MKKLYIDMDGVLSDFDTTYREIRTDLPDNDRFKSAVLDHQIFLHLKPMPDAKELMNYVQCLKNIHIEILTSVGTFDIERGHAAKVQKAAWLDKYNLFYPINFVRCKPEKAQFASKDTILIDDSIGCIEPFNKKGGWGILHTTAKTSIEEIENVFKKMQEYKAYTT